MASGVQVSNFCVKTNLLDFSTTMMADVETDS
jgi:hypothetical protein